jgi:hypothetical protein
VGIYVTNRRDGTLEPQSQLRCLGEGKHSNGSTRRLVEKEQQEEDGDQDGEEAEYHSTEAH